MSLGNNALPMLIHVSSAVFWSFKPLLLLALRIGANEIISAAYKLLNAPSHCLETLKFF